MTPTQRSLKRLRDAGYTIAITEHWNPFARVRQDLFGFIDLLAIGMNGIFAIQTTSGSNVAARIKKITELPAAREWLESGQRIFVHGWAKRGPRGKRKVWTCREVEITLADFVG